MSNAVNVNSLPSAKKETNFLANARDAYGLALSDWIEILATEANRTSGTAVAKRIGYSVAVVSAVCRGNYKGDLAAVETRVRGALMGHEVHCPGAGGMIRRDRCLREQQTPFNASSPYRVALYHACRSGCPHSRVEAKGGANV